MNETIKYVIIGAGNTTIATVNGKDAAMLVREEKEEIDIGAFIEPYIIRRHTYNEPTMIKPPKLSHRRNYKYHK